MQKKVWYSYHDLAERWGVCTRTLRLWMRDGKITPKKFSRSVVRFHVDEVERFERYGSSRN